MSRLGVALGLKTFQRPSATRAVAAWATAPSARRSHSAGTPDRGPPRSRLVSRASCHLSSGSDQRSVTGRALAGGQSRAILKADASVETERKRFPIDHPLRRLVAVQQTWQVEP